MKNNKSVLFRFNLMANVKKKNKKKSYFSNHRKNKAIFYNFSKKTNEEQINPQFIKSIPPHFEFLLILFIFVNV